VILTQFSEQFVVATSLIRRQHQHTRNIIICQLFQLQRVQNIFIPLFVNIRQLHRNSTGWPQSRREKIWVSPAFSRAIHLLFYGLSQQKVNIIMIFIKGHSTSTPVHSNLADIYWAGSLLPEIVMTQFTQSCFIEMFEWQTKTTSFVTIFPSGWTEFHENSLSFHVHRHPWVFQVCGNPAVTRLMRATVVLQDAASSAKDRSC